MIQLKKDLLIECCVCKRVKIKNNGGRWIESEALDKKDSKIYSKKKKNNLVTHSYCVRCFNLELAKIERISQC